MPPQRCLPEPWPHVDDVVGDRELKGGSLCWCGASCPGKGLAGGVHLALLLFGVSGLGVVSSRLVPLASPLLPSPALLSVAVGAAPTVRAQVKGSKGAPLLLYTDNRATITCIVSFLEALLLENHFCSPGVVFDGG